MTKRIHFEDHQQDLLWWDVDAKGEVIASNAQERVWVGFTAIAVHHVKAGDFVDALDKMGNPVTMQYVVVQVEELEPEQV